MSSLVRFKKKLIIKKHVT